jgi:hypothetical protein
MRLPQMIRQQRPPRRRIPPHLVSRVERPLERAEMQAVSLQMALSPTLRLLRQQLPLLLQD